MKQLRRSITAIVTGFIALVAAANAFALSCLPSSPERSFAQYEASPDQYYIFQGRFTPLQSVPQGSNYVERGGKPAVLFSFEGRAIGPKGLLPDVRRFELSVKPECAGPWCAGYPSANEAIYFLKYSDRGYSYAPTPCPGAQLSASLATRRSLVDCFAGACVDTSVPGGPIISPQPEPKPEPKPKPEPHQVDTCGKDIIQGFVGMRVSSLPPFVAASSKVRIYGKGDPVTMDFLPDRLNIELNRRNRIERVKCG